MCLETTRGQNGCRKWPRKQRTWVNTQAEH